MTDSHDQLGLSDQQRAMLAMLRNARALVHRDAESFLEAVTVLEHIGQMLTETVGNGLGSYREQLEQLASHAPPIQRTRYKQLFDTVRRARNDSVHTGAFIRHHTVRLVELLLVFEEALFMCARCAEDLMVQNPVVAELWHNVASVRRAMLSNSFSYLPVRDVEGNWKVVSDHAVARYLAENRDGLGTQLSTAIERNALPLLTCTHVRRDDAITDIVNTIGHEPVLVVETSEGQQRLLGILTAFDLL